MKKLKNFVVKLWNDEDGQGMAEYVLLIVVVLGVAFMFKGKIMELMKSKMADIGDGMGAFTVEK